ncbi:MAG: hypothetical protein EBX95_14975, partial [Acidimicrobiia bacterium]|nr:hypothetical protein [Acidimicrobiia bacterium]
EQIQCFLLLDHRQRHHSPNREMILHHIQAQRCLVVLYFLYLYFQVSHQLDKLYFLQLHFDLFHNLPLEKMNLS